MLRRTLEKWSLYVLVAGVVLIAVGAVGGHLTREAAGAEGAPKASPTAALANRDVYFPGTEDLAPDEMRVVGLRHRHAERPPEAGGGLLARRSSATATSSSSTSAWARPSASRRMKIHYDYLDKVFIGHLHADHIGDLDALWIGGVISNRQRPLRIWGPSGASPSSGRSTWSTR